MLYQVRFNLDDEQALALRCGTRFPGGQVLMAIFKAHNAEPVCQLDAFEDFCKENSHLATKARFAGDVDGLLPLFMWTDATLKDPEKRAKYSTNFTAYVDGEMLYEKDVADALAKNLKNLPFLEELRIHNDNPADNPPIPEEFLNI